ncbi:MAG: Asp-tRNA(Asn)/Glu-tRNA(Gln) amidotransferase subunit GatA [Clostridia bacterium]|nr:Asp-tRNA(Asn)/Glu-tRNA(Gln) amidotransferase subunit GatA [Clostridia bacterium]
MSIEKLTALEIAAKIKSKEVSAIEVAKHMVSQALKTKEETGAYITVTEDVAINQAKAVDEKIAKGEELGALAGVPFAIKDNICTKDILTTCGSKMLYNFEPPYDAFVTKRLADAGCVLIGKTNMDEFAMGSSNETSYFGEVKNPYNHDCVPGGSSGGSAAAVAANSAYFTLGSDTGGSIRLPASFCGVTGIKPTYGMVSRFGLVAFASSLDQIGPIAKDAADCAAVMNIISAYDNMDSTCLDVERPDYMKSLENNIKGLKIAVPKEYFNGADEDVKTAINASLKQLEEMGAVVEEVSLPVTDYALAAYYIISSAEASSNLARYDGVKYGYRAENFDNLSDMYFKTRCEGFGDEVKRRIMLGTYALSSGYYDAYYKKAQQVRSLIKDEFAKIFAKYDVIASPVYPTVAFKRGEKTSDPVKMYTGDICTVSANIAGIPGISVPCGFGKDNMPVGLQLMANAFKEDVLLKTAFAYQQVTDFHKCI